MRRVQDSNPTTIPLTNDVAPNAEAARALWDRFNATARPVHALLVYVTAQVDPQGEVDALMAIISPDEATKVLEEIALEKQRREAWFAAHPTEGAEVPE